MNTLTKSKTIRTDQNYAVNGNGQLITIIAHAGDKIHSGFKSEAYDTHMLHEGKHVPEGFIAHMVSKGSIYNSTKWNLIPV